MKKYFIIIIALILFIPSTVFASTQALNLIDTIESLELKPTVDDYKEMEDQVMIYIFRWETCDHCHDAIEYINNILPEYKDKIKMRSYETSRNEDNKQLQKKIANFLDQPKSGNGVPFIIIGENTFYGFGDDTGSSIIKAIDNVYSEKERYDVFEQMEKGEKKIIKKSSKNYFLIILIPIILIILIISIFLLFKKKNHE